MLLGPGSVPMTWLATQKDLLDRGPQLGLLPEGGEPVADASYRQWLHYCQLGRQLFLGLLLGLGLGFVVAVGQAATYFLPLFFQQTVAEYEAGITTKSQVENGIRVVWLLTLLVSPTALYALSSRLSRPQFLNQLWLHYAYQSDPVRWRQLVPQDLHSHNPDPTIDAASLRQRANRWVLDWPAWVIPAGLLSFFCAMVLMAVFASYTYIWLGNQCRF